MTLKVAFLQLWHDDDDDDDDNDNDDDNENKDGNQKKVRKDCVKYHFKVLLNLLRSELTRFLLLRLRWDSGKKFRVSFIRLARPSLLCATHGAAATFKQRSPSSSECEMLTI